MTIKREDLDAGRVNFSGIATGKIMPAVTPGVFMKQEFLDEYGLSVSAAAAAMKISRARLNEIVRGERGIMSAAGAGGDGLLTINFPNVGQKMVMLKYAPLERV